MQMFKVITLVTSKGGVGKSALARSLAAHWFALGHRPALVDADPQRTLANRYNPDGPLGGIPVVAEPEERVEPEESVESATLRFSAVHLAGTGPRPGYLR